MQTSVMLRVRTASLPLSRLDYLELTYNYAPVPEPRDGWILLAGAIGVLALLGRDRKFARAGLSGEIVL